MSELVIYIDDPNEGSLVSEDEMRKLADYLNYIDQNTQIINNYRGELYKKLYPDGRYEIYRRGELFKEYGRDIEYYVNGELYKKIEDHYGYDPDHIYENQGLIHKLKGEQTWYKNRKLHRENDLPALIDFDGTQEWYKNGKLHRESDLPAIITHDGHQGWFINGLRHRENDLPACVDADGSQAWFINGVRHRETGPAIIGNEYTEDGLEWVEEYWINGVELSFEDFTFWRHTG